MKSQDRPMYIPPPRGNGNLMSRKITRGLAAVSAACALGAAVILAACDSPAKPVTPDQSLSTTVSGKVTDAKNQGVEGVRISASGTAGDVTPVTTRSDGTFTLKVPHRGGFTLTAAKNGYDDKSQDFTTDKTAEIWDISLDFATTVSGKVSTDGTAGLVGVTVSVDGRGDITPVTTGDDGNYSLRVTHKGRFTLAAAKDGYVGRSRTFELTAVTPTENWNITLEGADVTTVVSGTVTGPTSASAAGNLEGVTISVEGRSDITPVTTIADGTYPNLSVPHTGSFTLRAAKNGYDTATETVTVLSSGAEVKNFTLALTETLVFESSKVRKSKMLVSTNGNANQTFKNPLRSTTIFAPEGNPVTAGAVYSIIDTPPGFTNEITLAADGTVSFGKPALDKVDADGPLTVTIQAAYQGKTTTYDFTLTDHFSGRHYHGSVAIGNDIYVVGGVNASGTGLGSRKYDDVWRSSDGGETWDQVAQGTRFSPRYDFGLVGWSDGSLYLIGGATGDNQSGAENSVWKSTDRGAAWSEVLSNDAAAANRFKERYGFGLAELGNDLYIIGGRKGYGSGQTEYTDVWKSSNGNTWTQLKKNDGTDVDIKVTVTYANRTTTDNNRPLSQTTALALGNALYLIPEFSNTIGRSSNGTDWTFGDKSLKMSNAPGGDGSLFNFSSAVLGNHIYIMGGNVIGGSTAAQLRNLVLRFSWSGTSANPTWEEITSTQKFPKRFAHSSVAASKVVEGRTVNTLYVIGGSDRTPSKVLNDVWKSTDGGVNWVNVHETTP